MTYVCDEIDKRKRNRTCAETRGPHFPFFIISFEKMQKMNQEEEQFIRTCFANLKKSENRQKVVLVSTGSFNPAHKMHIQVFSYANEFLIENNYDLVCGFVAPCSDDYV